MMEAMRELALLELNHRAGETGMSLGDIRARHGEHLTPLLVEDSDKIPHVYLLQAMPNQPGAVKMWVEEVDPAKAKRLPFVMSRVAAIGPVMKHSIPKHLPRRVLLNLDEINRRGALISGKYIRRCFVAIP